MGGVIIAELVQSSILPQLTSLPCGFEQSMFLVAGLLHGLSLPPPFVHSTVFLAETSLPNEGASTIARTAAMPIAKNIAFLFIALSRIE
jgi:hypothetical protein